MTQIRSLYFISGTFGVSVISTWILSVVIDRNCDVHSVVWSMMEKV